jgi:hypothetical protein
LKRCSTGPDTAAYLDALFANPKTDKITAAYRPLFFLSGRTLTLGIYGAGGYYIQSVSDCRYKFTHCQTPARSSRRVSHSESWFSRTWKRI